MIDDQLYVAAAEADGVDMSDGMLAQAQASPAGNADCAISGWIIAILPMKPGSGGKPASISTHSAKQMLRTVIVAGIARPTSGTSSRSLSSTPYASAVKASMAAMPPSSRFIGPARRGCPAARTAP